MRKLFFLITLAIVFTGCRQQQTAEVVADYSSLDFSTSELPKRSNINAKARAILKDWPEFKAFESGFDAFYKVTNNEELILAIEDLVEQQNILAGSEYPETFNMSQIKSRQKVLKTYILKVKAASEYRIATKEAALEMIAAYNAFRNQFNVIVNNRLDTELIFDD